MTVEARISWLMKSGVVIAGLFFLVGWIGQLQGYQYGGLFSGLGVASLLSLPLLRVLLSAVLFFGRGERELAIVSTFVLVVLLASFGFGALT